MRRFQMGKLLFLFATCLSSAAQAEVDYHTVGWVNTILPGGGELMMGNYGKALLQAGLEVGSFTVGYQMSRLSPLSIDGVPEDLPRVPNGGLASRRRGVSRGSQNNKKVQHALLADWFQEFGIKYHMVNVFNSYRTAAEGWNPQIEEKTTGRLFMAPFEWENLSSKWVYPALALTAGALVVQYQNIIQSTDLNRISRLNSLSQRMYDFTYIAVFPTGSAVPEEMFYRGFLQQEFSGFTHSPVLSVAMSSAAYAFSHSADDRLSAALTGVYLGLVANANEGSLSKAIAYHFWADIFSGIYQMFLVRKQGGKPPLFGISMKF